jgi:carbon storage regulator CsrA
MRLEGDVVKVGIEAPIHVPVHRHEVYEEILKNNQEALTQTVTKLPSLIAKAKPTAPRAVAAKTP